MQNQLTLLQAELNHHDPGSLPATAGVTAQDSTTLCEKGILLSVSERNALILEHLETVRYLARSVSERLPHHIEIEELVSAGLVGLVDAAQKFKAGKQVQFKSYAQFRIRGAILDSLRTLDWSPRELRRKGREMAEAIRTLASRLGRTPLDTEVAEEMGISLVAYQQMTSELKNTELGSLDLEQSDESGSTAMDFLAAPASENPLAICIAAQSRESLAAAIGTLPDKERLVLTLSFYEGLTLKEIGFTLGVVESRVCQIKLSAIRRLRKLLKADAGSHEA